MGAFLDKPKTEKHNEHGVGNGLGYGLSSMQGWRIEMEDAHTAVTSLPGNLKDWSFFAVFDGHAGARVSSHCSEHLLNSITSGVEEYQVKTVKETDGNLIANVKKGILQGFLKLDERMRTMPEVESGEDKSGTTAVCSLISKSHIFVANCGDSRAVMYRHGGVGFSTQDHKPINPIEKERIQNAGGSVMIERVNGSLAVSRALGDYEYKNVEGKGPTEQLVSPEPEIYVEERQQDDEFLVLACDGVWDVMSNEDLCAFVRSRLLLSDNLVTVTNQVVDACLYKGSRDNMSIVLVTLPGCPKVSQEAIQKEKEVEAILEKKITELVGMSSDMTISLIIQMIADEDIKGLPPGGGLLSKRGFMESVYKKLRPDLANTAWFGEASPCYDDDEGAGGLVFVPSDVMRERLANSGFI